VVMNNGLLNHIYFAIVFFVFNFFHVLIYVDNTYTFIFI
jgi:hypothetical protein